MQATKTARNDVSLTFHQSSQAACNQGGGISQCHQRKGRCGRVEPGICVRLYAEEDFNGRPEFTDPEILRTNLAAVILQMLHLRLGEITAFPFIEPPDGKAITDGFNTPIFLIMTTSELWNAK